MDKKFWLIISQEAIDHPGDTPAQGVDGIWLEEWSDEAPYSNDNGIYQFPIIVKFEDDLYPRLEVDYGQG